MMISIIIINSCIAIISIVIISATVTRVYHYNAY